jgi:DNA-binding NarL/FixJ family response regulator
VNLAVVGEEPLGRAGLAALLEEDADVLVVASVPASDAGETLSEVGPLDAIVWEVSSGGAVGLLEGDLDVPVVALVPSGTAERVALRGDLRAVLVRSATPEQLRAALAAVVQGLVVLAPEVIGPELLASTPADEPLAPLTPREREVLTLLARGLSNKGIARRLDVSEHTVKFHVASLLGKFAARSRTEVVARAVRAGELAL